MIASLKGIYLKLIVYKFCNSHFLLQEGLTNISIMVVGNKADLEELRLVPKEMAEQVSESALPPMMDNMFKKDIYALLIIRLSFTMIHAWLVCDACFLLAWTVCHSKPQD